MTTNPDTEVVGETVSREDAAAALAAAREQTAPEDDTSPADEPVEDITDAEIEADAPELDVEELEHDELEEVETDELDPEDDEGEDLVTVKIDGEEQDVPLSEVINGYQRQADYTRKMQALGDDRRKVERQAQEVQTQSVAYAQSYLKACEMFTALAPTEQQIEEAWSLDPREAAGLKQRREAILQQGEAMRGMAIELRKQQQDTLRSAMKAAGEQLPELVPEWADPNDRQKGVLQVAEYLVQQGIPPHIVETTPHPQSWVIARKAMLYDQLQQSTEAKVKRTKAPSIRKTRASRSRQDTGTKSFRKAKAGFQSNPTKENAAAAIAAARRK